MKLTGSMCECCACGLVFSSEAGFNKHRVGKFGIDRRCLPVEDLEALGLRLGNRGWGKPMAPETLAALRGSEG